MVPVTLALGLINFSFVVNTFFASRFVDPQLAPSAIDAAFRIYMLPQGLFAVAVATVLFPRLSRLAARGELAEFRDWISLGLRQIGFLLVPASAVAAVLAEPVVRLLYQRGEFTAGQTPVVAGALAAFALGLTFNGTMLLLNRSFFSLQSPWVPTAVALGTLALNAILAAVLYRVGVWGIPLATSLVNVAGTLALIAILRKRLGRLDGTAIASSYGRIALASLLAAGAAFGIWYGLDETLGRSLGAQVVSVGVAILAATSVYLASAALFRVRELQTLLSLRRGSATTDSDRP
jgi:putative peptidoglycan lipid II flippase